MIFLSFLKGPHAGHQLEIEHDRIEVGRDPHGALALQDERCSWHHCVLLKELGQWWVVDLGSRNGTHVNGEQLTANSRRALAQGDVVKVGQSELEVRYPEEHRSTQIAHLSRSKEGQRVLVLSVAGGPLAGSAIRGSSAQLVVGSKASCDVCLPGQGVAEQAAVLRWVEDHYDLERTDDMTDIRVYGGLVVLRAPLPQGAILQVGEHIMEVGYESPGATASFDGSRTSIVALSDDERARVANSIENFAEVLRQSKDNTSVEIKLDQGFDVSLGRMQAPTQILGMEDTRAMSADEKAELHAAIHRFQLEISGGAAVAEALASAATGLRGGGGAATAAAAATATAAAPPPFPGASGGGASMGRTQAIDAVDEARIREMVDGMRAGKVARMAQGGPTPTQSVGSGVNPTAPWEGAGEGPFLVERDDASKDPVPVPEKYRLRGKLIFLSGPHTDRKVYLGKDPISIGRASDNFVPLSDGLASRYHCEIVPRRRGYELTVKAEVTNKPTVNGRVVQDRLELNHRDLITIGSNVIEYHSPGIDPIGEDATRTVMVPQPRYAFLGQVLVQWAVTVGREPTSDIYLDHESVERHHAQIQFFDGGFRLLDTSIWGCFVNGKRVVDVDLKDGDVIQVGGYKLTLHIEGLRCSIDAAFPEQASDMPEFAPDVDSAAPEKVLYRKAVEGEGGEKKKKKLQWVPPRDVQRSALGPLVVLAGVVVVLGLVGYATARSNGFFLNRPLSTAHDCQEFERWADVKLGTAASCTACHKPFAGAVADACASCHTDQHARVAHVEAAEAGKVKLDCLSCHSEHKGEARRTALLQGERCAECHEDRHAKLLKVTPGPVELTAPDIKDERLPEDVKLSLRADVPVSTLHAIHEHVERRCTGCHANEDMSGPVDPRTACLRCHEVKEQLSDARCNMCHTEHRQDMERVASVGAPMFGKPGGWGGAGILVVLLFLPLGIVIAFHQAVRRLLDSRQAPAAGGAAAAGPAPGGEKLEININIDKCVGCASCVNACPHEVLALEPKRHKSTVVKKDNCTSCRACEQICPSGALTMAPAGAPPRMVELPDLDSHYMTNIKGIYLIGEASGKSLVKNANNLGRRVVEHMMTDGVRPGAAAAAGVDVEVIAVGSGPGGMSVGISALTRGLTHLVFEKDRKFSSTIQTYPKGKELLAEPPEVENIGPLPVWDSYKEEILGAWEKELLKYPSLQLRLGEEVTNIVQRAAGGFEITTVKGTYTCLRVVLGTGTRGNPRGLKVPGGDSEKVNYILVDPGEHKGHHCMVVGGGDSAVEAAMALAEADPGNVTSISYRKADFGRIKPRNNERLMAMVQAGRITLHLETNPTEIRPDAVVLKKGDGSTVEVKNDYLYCMLGADPPVKWLQTIGIRYVQKPESWSPGPTDDLSFLDLESAAS